MSHHITYTQQGENIVGYPISDTNIGEVKTLIQSIYENIYKNNVLPNHTDNRQYHNRARIQYSCPVSDSNIDKAKTLILTVKTRDQRLMGS